MTGTRSEVVVVENKGNILGTAYKDTTVCSVNLVTNPPSLSDQSVVMKIREVGIGIGEEDDEGTTTTYLLYCTVPIRFLRLSTVHGNEVKDGFLRSLHCRVFLVPIGWRWQQQHLSSR